MRLSKHNFSSNSIHLRGNIKKWITGFLIIFIVIGINTTYNTYSRSHNISSEEEQNSNKNPSPKTSTGEIASQLRYGTATEPVELDPHYSWDGASINVIDQVCEGLFTYDFSDPELSIIPNLASSFGTWSFDKINYTIPLRIGIKFHDGTPFNATAVKWSFDRLNYFSNVSGTLLPPKVQSLIDSWYKWPDTTPIINKTVIINDFSIRFVLNRPFIPLIGLLCFSGSYILSPSSTPSDEYIDLATGDLIGTGPFIYDNYIPGSGVNFHAFENYWKGKASIDILKFTTIYDAVERNNALLSGDIDFLASPQLSYLSVFEADPNVIVEDAGSDVIMNYIGMNNKQINKTMRKAISYSVNYSYLIEEYMHGYASRLKSPIPEGILYSNSSFNVPVMNITHARSILVNGGVCNFDIYDDTDWLSAASFNPLATYNFTYYNAGYTYEICDLIQENLEQIGIMVNDAGSSWSEYLNRLFKNHNEVQLYWSRWGPDYNDPDGYIRPLLSNSSSSNSAQVNDPWLQSKIEDSLEESNELAREAIFDEIQQYVVEDLVPWAYCYVGRNFDAYRNGIINNQANGLGILSFYHVSWKTFNVPFNGMYANFSVESNVFGSGPGNLVYSQSSNELFHMSGNLHLLTVSWDVNPYTRGVTSTGGDFPVINGSHTPIWISPDVNIGNNVLITVDGEGDHIFQVSAEKSIDISGYGNLEAWELIDLTEPGGIVYYEKSTGILLNGTFVYSGGIYSYSFTLVETNALSSEPPREWGIDNELVDLINLYTPSYYNDFWNITLSQFKAWIALITLREAGLGRYVAHSRGRSEYDGDNFNHIGAGADFQFSTGIGAFQLDNGGDQGNANENWSILPTIEKIDPEISLLSVLRWHQDRFNWVNANLFNFSSRSAWYAVQPTNEIEFAGTWKDITGYNWDDCKTQKLDVGFNPPLTSDALENEVIYKGKIRWYHDNFNGYYDTWLINSRKWTGEIITQYYYTYREDIGYEVWVYNDPGSSYIYMFERNFTEGQFPEDRIDVEWPSIAGITAESPILDPDDILVIPEWREDIEVGDVLLHNSGGGLDMVLEWTHAGIYIGNDLLIEAVPDGVILSSISEWDDDKNVALLRVTTASESQRDAAALWAQAQVGKSYSYLWWDKRTDPTSLAWYCSELAWAAYKNQGIDIDFDESKYFVSPDDIYKDGDMEEIGGYRNNITLSDTFLKIKAMCPVNIQIEDPDGNTLSRELFGIFDSYYLEGDMDYDGEMEDIILISQLEYGYYYISVIPDENASITDTFTLEVSTIDTTITLCQDLPINDISTSPFFIFADENGIYEEKSGDSQPEISGYEMVMIMSLLVGITIIVYKLRKNKTKF